MIGTRALLTREVALPPGWCDGCRQSPGVRCFLCSVPACAISSDSPALTRAVFVHGPLCPVSVPLRTLQGAVHSCSPFLELRALFAFTALSSVSSPGKLVLLALAVADTKAMPLLGIPSADDSQYTDTGQESEAESGHPGELRATSGRVLPGHWRLGKEGSYTQRKSGRIQT